MTPAGPRSSRIARARRDEVVEVAAVDPDRLDRRLDRRGVPHPFERVVGVDQQRRRCAEDAGEGRERRRLVGERLDPGVGHRARRGDAQPPRRLRHGSSRRSRRGTPPAPRGSPRAARGPAGRRSPRAAGPPATVDDPRRLRRHQGRIAERGQQEGLDPLRLRQRRRDPQQRLAREDDRPLGHRPDVALEPNRGRARRRTPGRLAGTPAIAASPRSAPARRPAAAGRRSPAPARRRPGRRGWAAACGRTARTMRASPAIPDAR